MEEVGWAAKEIIDFGRVLYLQNRFPSYECRSLKYIDSSVTQENRCIIIVLAAAVASAVDVQQTSPDVDAYAADAVTTAVARAALEGKREPSDSS
jgi:hypothetical protein